MYILVLKPAAAEKPTVGELFRTIKGAKAFAEFARQYITDWRIFHLGNGWAFEDGPDAWRLDIPHSICTAHRHERLRGTMPHFFLSLPTRPGSRDCYLARRFLSMADFS